MLTECILVHGISSNIWVRSSKDQAKFVAYENWLPGSSAFYYPWVFQVGFWLLAGVFRFWSLSFDYIYIYIYSCQIWVENLLTEFGSGTTFLDP